MSREIKFRAFDTLEKKYMYYTLERGIVSVTSEFNSLDSNRLNDEQYTSLKDKNGVEIYEGDLFEYEILLKMDNGGTTWVNYLNVIIFENSSYKLKTIKPIRKSIGVSDYPVNNLYSLEKQND